MTRLIAVLATVVLALPVAFGVVRVLAHDATPTRADPTTFTLVERAEHVTTIDVGDSGPSPGDILVWGPDPLFDATNTTDTGATTQGTCLALHGAGGAHCTETLLFPDGATLEIQGVQPPGNGPSSRTVVGGSGRYLDAAGTAAIVPSDDLTTWTKTFSLAP